LKGNQGKRQGRKIRKENGIYLIETLVAIILSTMFSLALLQIFAETMRVTSTNTNKQEADLIAQTVLDAFKSLPTYNWSSIPTGSFDLLPYGTTPGQMASGGHPLPVGLNFGDLQWLPNTTQFPVPKFPGTVNLTISQGPDLTSYIAVVTVTWSDGEAVDKVVQTCTVTEQQGINYWP
jgi:type II secretory pathway pseudopilin PulG